MERWWSRLECRTDRSVLKRQLLCHIGQVLSFARAKVLAHVTDASGLPTGSRKLASQAQVSLCTHTPSSSSLATFFQYILPQRTPASRHVDTNPANLCEQSTSKADCSRPVLISGMVGNHDHGGVWEERRAHVRP